MGPQFVAFVHDRNTLRRACTCLVRQQVFVLLLFHVARLILCVLLCRLPIQHQHAEGRLCSNL